MMLVTKRVAMAPFELKFSPNESYRRAASVEPPPGAKKAQIRAKIRVKLQGSAAWAQPLKFICEAISLPIPELALVCFDSECQHAFSI